MTNITNGGGIKYFRANSTLADSQAQGLDSVAIGPNAVAKNASDVALGNGSVTDTAVATTGATINGNAYTFAGAAPTSTVIFRQINGVAAGTADSDAVNVAQLKAISQSVATAGDKWIVGSPASYKAPTSVGTDSTAVGSGASVTANNSVAMRNIDLSVPDVDWEWERYHFLPMMNTVEFGPHKVHLRTDEFDLATELFSHAGRTLTRKQLCEAIWDHDGHDKSRSLDACASRLRRALQLEQNGWALRAVWGAGYRLDGPSAAAASPAAPALSLEAS